MKLTVLSYLAPSVPAELFAALADHVEAALSCEVELCFDASRSGPRPGEHDPLRAGEVDLAFVCATSYVWMTGGADASCRLAGAAWVPTDPRSAGRAIYFGDVLVPMALNVRGLADLAGRRVAYNDDVSLSGYYSLRLALGTAGVDAGAVDLVCSGSHLQSLELLRHGKVDAAAIDSNVWRRRRREDPLLARDLQAVAALGPHPVQPVVVRAGLAVSLVAEVCAALLEATTTDRVGEAMADAEFSGFTRVDEGDYAELRTQLAAAGF